MATAESVKTQLTALLNQANDTTGKTDETLTAAIASLISGFGGGGRFAHLVTFTPATVGYVSKHLFLDLNLTPTYEAGMIFSRGNTDLSSDTGNAIFILLYTYNRYLAIALGSHNNTLQSGYEGPNDRTETGPGGKLGVENVNVGNTRSGYTIIGKTYHVYEAEISSDVVSRLIDYTEETE